MTREQLRRCGIGDNTVDRWVGWKRLHPVFRGVFALGRPELDEEGRILAAVLACAAGTRRGLPVNRRAGSSSPAQGALASHRAAGYLLGMVEPLPVVIDVTSLGQAGRGIDGIRGYHVVFPEPDERGLVDGIPCTSVARTLVDLAGMLSERSLRKAVERAATNKSLNVAAVEAVLDRRRRRGEKPLRSILEEWRPVEKLAGGSKLRSPFEAHLLPLLAAVPPLPRVNARVAVAEGTLEVDLLWAEQRLVVEADSRRHHGIEAAFERDRRRDRELIDAGYLVIRVTWRQAERESDQIAATVRRLLERRGPTGPGDPRGMGPAPSGITPPAPG